MMTDTTITLPDVNVAAKAPTSQSQIGTSAPYARRKITLTFQLGAGNFHGTGANKVTIEGLRVHFQCSQALTPAPSQAMLRVFGLTLDQINQLTKAGTLFTTPGNKSNFVTVQAGDWGGTLTTVYRGEIFEAYPRSKLDVRKTATRWPVRLMDHERKTVLRLSPQKPAVPVGTAI